MKVLKLVAFIMVGISSTAQIPPGYYDSTFGLTGEPLKQALHDIITGHNTLQYSQLWAFFPNTDDHPTGRLWDIYSDIPGGTAPYTYQFSDQCGQYNNEGDCYNREHSFPKSWYNDAYPMFSDLHAIYPVDGYVNGKRGNLPYGEVGSPDWTSDNGSKTGASSIQGYSNTVFEPIDAFKGDLARTYFYMLTRYKDEAPNWQDASILPMVQNGTFTQWAEFMLLQWHLNDPVSAKEQDRNNAVHSAQNNRNPFIDNPQWVESIWGPTAAIAESDPVGFSVNEDILVISDETLMGEAYTISDLTGRLIARESVSSNRVNLEVSSPGIYLLRFQKRTIKFSSGMITP